MTSLPANLAALARRFIGTSANNLVALDGAAKLPPVDGSQLTGLGRKFAAQQTLTGLTSVDWTGIPDGVDKVVLGLFGAAASGGVLRVRLGNQSGILTSGYVGSISSRAGEVTVTDSFGLSISTSSYCDGIVTLERLTGNMWGYSTVLGSSAAQNGGGRVDLLATPLRSIRLFGTAAFNSGVATLAWG